MTRARTIAACHASVVQEFIPEWTPSYTMERQLAQPAYDEARAAAYRADWQETDQLMDEAWQAFMQHGDRHRYRADCRRVIERGEA
jgi:hypothetical protein